MKKHRNTRRILPPVTAAAVCILLGLLTTALVLRGTEIPLSAAAGAFASSVLAKPVADTPSEGLPDPGSELRGVWIASVENIDFPSEQGLDAYSLARELDDIVSSCRTFGFNAIFFQVRPTSDALYDSALFPTSVYLTGSQTTAADGGFDPLGYLLKTAHAQNIQVHAWVNPLRVTAGTAEEPQTDLHALAPNNPARMFPDWVIPYADGRLYYDAGRPEVRELVAAGVAEIVRGYDVDGVVFDDYFYPYPVSGAVFDDSASYAAFGGGLSRGDWRRDNVDQLVSDCYNAVKSIDRDCLFGIAPFGIWQNDDGKNGGSATSGMSAYSAIYCDPLAWMEGGYIDYIAPQIYWQFTTSAARYDVLVHWWNKQALRYGVDLLICHADYRSADFADNEIRSQVEFARSEAAYRGSVHYGYSAIRNNTAHLQKQLKELYSEPVIYSDAASTGAAVTVNSPLAGSYLSVSSTYLLGSCDPGLPLTLDGEPVSVTRHGFFSAYVSLKNGKNAFTFRQGDRSYTYTVTRGSAPSGGVVYETLDSFAVTGLSPSSATLVPSGYKLTLSCTAPSGCSVTARVGKQTVTLSPTIYPRSTSAYMKEVYTGSVVLPGASDGQIADLGRIVYTAQKGGSSVTATGQQVRVAGKNASVTVVVAQNDTELKVSADSWYYDDYTPASTGMTDTATSCIDGYYKLRMGGLLDASKCTETTGAVPIAQMGQAYVLSDSLYTAIYVKTGVNVPVNAYVDGSKLIFSLYNVDPSNAREMSVADNPLFTGKVTGTVPAKKNTYRYTLELVDPDNFYGFTVSYINGHVKLNFRNPQTVDRHAAKPLAGKTILLDAGHGGTDSGARSPSDLYNEDDLNLAVVLRAAELLKAEGANVVLSRDTDRTVGIYTRIGQYEALIPDLLISVHQNSMPYDTEVEKISGLVGLYFADSGKLLADCVASGIADTLMSRKRATEQQRLAMVRNVQFPSTLVEITFVTCAEEYETMLWRDGIEKAARGLVEGIYRWYDAQAAYLK